MLTGIIMCGGKSIRMGTDKGLILKGNQTWAELAYHKLASLHLPTKVSINPSQLESYKNLFNQKDFVIDNINIPGPLAGLISAHNEFPNKDLLLLACDMTDVSTETIQNLINTYNDKKNEYDFFVFKNEGNYEPLLGIYTHKGIQKINQLFIHEKLTRYSMKHILDIGKTFSVLLEEGRKVEFRNYNEPLL